MLRDALRTMQLIALLLWPLHVWAASKSLGETFSTFTIADWVTLLALSGFSGLVALLNRVKRSYEAIALAAAGRPSVPDDQLLIDWRLFAICHLAGALFAGFLAFLGGEAWDMNNHLQAIGIALASWGGAKAADKWADSFTDRIASVIGTKGAGPTG